MPKMKSKPKPKQPAMYDNMRNMFSKARIVSTATPDTEFFIINRFLSMSPVSFIEACDANRVANKMHKSLRMPLLFHTVPCMKAPYIKYIKNAGAKNKETPRYKELVLKIMAHFHCKEKYAHQIFEILDKQGRNVYHDFGCKAPGERA